MNIQIKIVLSVGMKKEHSKKGSAKIKGQNRPGVAGIIVRVVIFAVEAFLFLGLTWLLSIWHDITFDEIVFYLSAPLEGTSHDFMNSFYLRVLLLLVIAVCLFALLTAVLKKKKKHRELRMCCTALFIVLSIGLICQAGRAVVRYRVADYVRSRFTQR